MKKIAIITYPEIEDGKGRFLQAYALYEAVTMLGYDVDVLNYIPELRTVKRTTIDKISRAITSPNQWLSYIMSTKALVYNRIERKSINNSKKKYLEFIHNNMHYTSRMSKEDVIKQKDLYDKFICGSDQIWNPNYACGKDDIYYLTFVEKDRSVAYAASLGTLNLSTEQYNEISRKIREISFRSVREKGSKKQLKELCGVDVEQVCDPTFLMDKKWWDLLADTNPINSNKYILEFCFDNNYLPRKIARQIARKHGFEVVTITETLDDMFYKGRRISGIGPNDFVSLFKNAEFVCTQSFHGVVLSIIYNTPFFVFDRREKGQVEGLSLRIKDLLDTYHLRNRFIPNDYKLDCDMAPINFEGCNLIMEKERNRAMNYLRNALIS